MYDGPAFNRKRGGVGGLMSGGGGPSKLVVSNLDYGVSTADIQVSLDSYLPQCFKFECTKFIKPTDNSIL